MEYDDPAEIKPEKRGRGRPKVVSPIPDRSLGTTYNRRYLSKKYEKEFLRMKAVLEEHGFQCRMLKSTVGTVKVSLSAK